MTFDLKNIYQTRSNENLSLHEKYINPQMAKVLKTIGFDRTFVSAEGPYLTDSTGIRYVDFLSGYGVFAMGRNHPVLKKALSDFLELNTANLVQMEAPILSGLLAEKLVNLVNLPGVNKVFFTNSGTEAIEGAIKYVKCATGRSRLLFMDHAFHGLSNGSLSMNGNDEFTNGFGPLLPDCTKVFQNDLEQLEKELQKKDVAAFFFEPIQGKGVYVPNDDYLPAAQALCKKYGTLFVADEIQSGLGRTGKWFAYEHWNLSPDIICTAKALSGGMVPVGAIIAHEDVTKKVFSRMDRCVVHSSTFGQNNAAMVCGLAAIEVIQDEKLMLNAQLVGQQLMDDLKKLALKHEWISEIRGKGLMIGIEFGKPTSLRKKLAWNLVHSMDKGLFGELIVMPLMSKHHYLTQVSGHHQDVVKLIPPLIITTEHASGIVAALDNILQDCEKISGPIFQMGKNLAKASLENRKNA